MLKRLFTRHAIWLRDKSHFLAELTLYLWVLNFAAFGWAFQRARGFGFWLFLTAICLLGALAAAQLIWHIVVKPRIDSLPSETRDFHGP